VRRALTIRSSGPLRRVAVLSGRGQQRPLNSSVRPQRAHLVLGGVAYRVTARLSLHRASFVPQLGRPAFRAHVQAHNRRRRSRANQRIARASRARHWHSPRDAVTTRTLVSVVRHRQRRPSLPRAVAVFSSRRYCLLKVVHSVRPNYSFKRTAATGCGTIMPRSAAAA
jgi:hypothetical protein